MDYLAQPIEEKRQTEAPVRADGYTKRSGAPTPWLIRLTGEKRWRRVMAWQFSNAGTVFVRIKGKCLIIREELFWEV